MKKAFLFVLVLAPMSWCYAASSCGSTPYQYTLNWCAQATGVAEGSGKSSLISDNCYYAANYMEAHKGSNMSADDAEKICAQAPWRSGVQYCTQAVWAYLRAKGT